MAVKRGTSYRTRANARNFTHDEAQRRLDETVKPFNKQVVNALNVDYVECSYFLVQDRTGRPCSCQKQKVDREDTATNVPVSIPSPRKGDGLFDITLQDVDFMGEKESAQRTVIDVSGDSQNIESKSGVGNNESLFEDGIFGANSVDCGICHRVGFQPGYQSYGKQRTLLTHFDILAVHGVMIDRAEAPHLMRKSIPDGYVEYPVKVPKLFKSVRFRIYEGHAPVPAIPTLRNGQPIDLLFFQQCAGHETVIRVPANHTHVVIEFDLGLPPLKINISGEQKSIDYERLETMSDITVVIPPTVSEVNSRDIIIIPERRLALRVTDKERKITSTKRLLEWSVTTRVLQPTEKLKRLDDLRRLF